MSGNALEWTGSEDPETSLPIVRGGGLLSHLVNVRTFSTLPVRAKHSVASRPVGFRCAREVR